MKLMNTLYNAITLVQAGLQLRLHPVTGPSWNSRRFLRGRSITMWDGINRERLLQAVATEKAPVGSATGPRPRSPLQEAEQVINNGAPSEYAIQPPLIKFDTHKEHIEHYKPIRVELPKGTVNIKHR